MNDSNFETLLAYLIKVPGVEGDIDHVLNYLSVDERLPTVFYPASPPLYMSGGPEEFLSWVIENSDPEFSPNTVREWLEGRLPLPVDDLDEWNVE